VSTETVTPDAAKPVDRVVGLSPAGRRALVELVTQHPLVLLGGLFAGAFLLSKAAQLTASKRTQTTRSVTK
jgi:hypothetical protein